MTHILIEILRDIEQFIIANYRVFVHVINHDKTIARNLYLRPVSNLSRICKRVAREEREGGRSTKYEKIGDEFRIRTIDEYRFYIFKGRVEIPEVCVDIATEDNGALVKIGCTRKKIKMEQSAAVISFLGAFCSPCCVRHWHVLKNDRFVQ